MKKALCFLVVFVMIISMVACAKSEKEPKDTGSATTTAATEVNPFEEFMEITWLCMENANYEEGGWAELEIEEKFNVDIKIWPMDSNNTEQMAALVAAGDIADYNEMRGGPRSPVDMYLEGLTRSIPLQAIKDHLPGMYRLLEMMPIGFKYNLVPGTTDEYLGLTHVGFGSAQYFYETVCINLDWLEAIGYTVDNLKPVKIATEGYEHLSENIFVGEGNFTFEEYNDILRKFTEDDPDGNGEDDTYGMMYFGEINMPDHEVAKRYHELWEIEHSFRITKSDLETRPVYVTLKQRIEGHFLTCFIALLILRLLAKRLNKEYAPEQIIKSLRKYQACLVKDNVYRVAYYDPLLKDIGNALNLVLNQRFLKPGAIRQLIADTKR